MKTLNGINVNTGVFDLFERAYLEMLGRACSLGPQGNALLITSPDTGRILQAARAYTELDAVWTDVGAIIFGEDAITLHKDTGHACISLDDLKLDDLVDVVSILVSWLKGREPQVTLPVPLCLDPWFPGTARQYKEASYQKLQAHMGNLPENYVSLAALHKWPWCKAESVVIDNQEIQLTELNDSVLDSVYRQLFVLLYTQAVKTTFWLSKETFARELNVQLPDEA